MNLKEFYIDEVDIEPRKKWLNEKVYYKTDVDLAVAELKKRGFSKFATSYQKKNIYVLTDDDFNEVFR